MTIKNRGPEQQWKNSRKGKVGLQNVSVSQAETSEPLSFLVQVVRAFQGTQLDRPTDMFTGLSS